ncbi:fb0c449a-208e-4f7a-aad9-60192385aded-CDS [Sclerotinia trifoliorum]|uniref:Fb0c449a-208e-4f7a-aad9-60192385aded-CDS n=1 Tax=Sclerotinia trifoliorum TaxID=28548 RepID=A0A8H2ZPZ3_9HELO|nr:fb0c449a-208e-4f7a-aad9-60192385aded-CDS [Sclerotinia trifoliorum]
MASSINLPTSDMVRSSPSYSPFANNAPFIHWREKFQTLKEMNHLKDAVQADIVHKCERLGESILDPYIRQADYDGY